MLPASRGGCYNFRVSRESCSLLRSPSSRRRLSTARDGGILLAADWREQVSLERETAVRLGGFPDRYHLLWAGDGRRYVADIEQVSGGTAASLIEVSDPEVRWAGTGLDIGLGVRPVPGTPWLQVWLQGRAAETTFGRTTLYRTNRTVAPDGEGGFRPTGAKIQIDLPAQKTDDWKHVVTIPAGRACLLKAVTDDADPDKVRILAVEAR